ncbi:MAG: cmk [Verrucomicrobiales bacterium]|nr:cmk [Verrucomicrobiales bacterium]
MNQHIVIAIDGTSASGKSTNARMVARELGYIHVDTGAMYRTLAWYCLHKKVDLDDVKAVSALCRRWKTSLECTGNQIHLLVDGYFPDKEIRTSEVTEAVSHIAAFQKVRDWMKAKQRECAKFGNLVMEGRDIGTNVFPESEFKFYLDACITERSKRRAADGVQENLAARDQRDSQRASAPLMVALGAMIVNTSLLTPQESSAKIIAEIRKRLADNEQRQLAKAQM